MGRSEGDMEAAYTGARVLAGLAIRGAAVHGAENGIRNWIALTGLEF